MSFSQAALDTALAVSLRPEALGLIGGLAILTLSTVLTWFTARTYFSAYNNAFAPYETLLFIRLDVFLGSVAVVLVKVPESTVGALRNIIDFLANRWSDILISLGIAIICFVVANNHQSLVGTVLRVRCEVIDFYEDGPLRLLNVVRNLYNGIYPLVDLVVQLMRRLAPRESIIRELKACAAELDFYDLIQKVGDIAAELASSVSLFFTGDFLTNRLQFVTVMQQIALLSNLAKSFLMCICAFLEPIINFAVALLQQPELHLAVEAILNIPIRAGQVVLYSLVNQESPFFSDLAEEIIVAVVSLGDYVEVVVRLIILTLTNILEAIGVVSLSAAMQPLMSASLKKKSIYPTDFEGGLGAEGYVVSLEKATLSDIIHAVERTWGSTLSRGDYVERAEPIWDLPQNNTLNGTEGRFRILRILNTHYMRIGTKLVGGAVCLVNITLNVISKSYTFHDPTYLAYFQFGEVFGYLRESAAAVADLTVIIDYNLPALIALLAAAVITVYEAIAEMVLIVLTSIIFPTWLPGEDPPYTDCNGVTSPCVYPPIIADWTIFNIAPAYYNWTNNGLRRSLRYLNEDADALAIAFGCNATAVIANCTPEYPFQCVLRTSYLLTNEVANQTLAFIFYLPDFVRFNYQRYTTILAISFVRIAELAHQLVDCIANFVELLDDESCRTDQAPPGETPIVGPLPTLPLRATTDSQRICGTDGLVYEYDGRLLVQTDPVTKQDYVTYCDYNASASSGCLYLSSSNTPSDFIASGNAPRTNLTIRFRPTNQTAYFPFYMYTATDYTSSYTFTNFTFDYNITSITSTDCTIAAPPFPDPYPPGLAIAANNASVFYRPLDNRLTGVLRLGRVYYHIDTYVADGLVDVNPGTGTPYFADALHATVPLDLIPNLVCDGASFGLEYDGERVMTLDVDGLYKYMALCSVEEMMCRYNRLYVNSETYPVFFSMAPIRTEFTHREIPCTYTLYNYTCIGGTAYAAMTPTIGDPRYPLIYDYNASTNTTSYQFITCTDGTKTVQEPCRRVEVQYNTGVNYTVVVSGHSVFHYIDGISQATQCAILDTNISSSSTLLNTVQGIYGSRDGSNTHTTTWDQRMDATAVRVQKELQIHAADIDDPYRRQNFICCIGDLIRSAGRFYIALALEIILTVQSFLALPAFIINAEDYTFRVPTFREAKDELRNAFCSAACALMNIIPADLFECSALAPLAGCGTSNSCASSLLCHIVDVLLLVVEVFVEVLEVIRIVTSGDNDPDNSPALYGDQCKNGEVTDCIAELVVYVLTKILYTLTRVIRDAAALINCFFCSLGSIFFQLECDPGFYNFFNALMNVVDSIGKTIFTTAVKILLSVVSAIIYLFSGTDDAFALFIAEVGKIIQYLVSFLGDIANLIIGFLKKLPVVGPVFQFVANIFGGVCDLFQAIANAFDDDDNPVDLGCVDVDWTFGDDKRKRSILTTSATTGWMRASQKVRAVWSNEASSCSSRMAELNATAFELLTDENAAEVAICKSAHYWLREFQLETSSSACEYTMTNFFSRNVAWNSLPLHSPERGEVARCAVRRTHTLASIRQGYDFLPHDVLDDYATAAPKLIMQLVMSFNVYRQYAEDRSLPVEILRSSAHRNNWAVSGYSIAHLDQLQSLSEVDTLHALSIDDARYGLSIEQYAERAANLKGMRPSVLAATARFWTTFYGSDLLTATGTLKRVASIPSRATALLGQFLNYSIHRLAAQEVLPAPRINLTLMVNEASANSRYLHLGSQSMFTDVPIIAAKFIQKAQEEHVFSHAKTAAGSVAQLMYAASIAGVGVMRDMVQGRRNPLALMLTPAQLISGASVAGTAILGGLSTVATASGRAGGPKAVFDELGRIWNTDPVGVARRQKMASFVSMVGSTFVQEMLPTSTAAHFEPYILPRPPVRVSNVSNQDCNLAFTDICDQCDYVGELLTEAITAFQQCGTYYQGTQDPSYLQGKAEFDALNAYLDDESVPVEIGDSAELPILFPWAHFNNWRILGDRSHNRGFYSNFTSLFSSFTDLIFGGAQNSTQLFSVAAANARTAVAHMAGSMSGVNYVTGMLISNLVGTSPAAPSAAGSMAKAAANENLGNVLLGVYTYVYEWFKLCKFTMEIDGSDKQLSIAESAFVIIVIALGLALLTTALLRNETLTILMALVGGTTASLIVLPLVFSYRYSYKCMPALPYGTANDVVWALTHTVLPGCDPYIAGIITNRTETGATAYTNTACRECDNYDDDTGWAYADCFGEVGFKDVFYNAVFTVRFFFDGLVEGLNNTKIPVVREFIRSDYVQQHLSTFTAFNRTDAVTFANTWSCNYQSFPINLGMLAPLLYFMQLAWPLINLIASTLISLLIPTLYMFILFYHVGAFLAILPAVISNAEEEARQSDTPETAGAVNFSNPLPRYVASQYRAAMARLAARNQPVLFF